MRLATDMAQLELALAPLASTAELATASEYAALRHLRPMLFQSTEAHSNRTPCDPNTGILMPPPPWEEILADRGSAMPPSAVVHHLLTWVHPEIPLPHRFLEWTPAE